MGLDWAATEGVTPIFPAKKLTTFLVITVGQLCSFIPIHFLLKTDDLFCSSLSLLLISLGCRHLENVTPHFFLPVPRRLSTILCKFTHKKYFFPFGCYPLEGVTWGNPPPPVTPLFVIVMFYRGRGGLLRARDEIILGISMGPVGPMGFPWEWESLG